MKDGIRRVIDEETKVISIYYKETLIFSLEYSEELVGTTSCSGCNLSEYCLGDIFGGDTNLSKIICSSIFSGKRLNDFQYPVVTEEEAKKLYLGLRGRVIKRIIRK